MYRILEATEITSRYHFPTLCNKRNVRIAVELGTDRGVFAKKFMDKFTGWELVCIDPYRAYEELPGQRLPDMLMAINALQPWHGRVRMMQTTSAEALAVFPPWLTDYTDFVYIDAQHDYASVIADIRSWWPVLSEHGILAGHDYDETHPGVILAVKEFAKENDLTVMIVTGDQPDPPSWYIYKDQSTLLIDARS
jgi:hypothetical protein